MRLFFEPVRYSERLDRDIVVFFNMLTITKYGGDMDFVLEVRRSAGIRIFYTDHALSEMLAEDEIIATDEIRHVIFEGEIIEEYPEDKRGHSCLMFARTAKRERAVHIVCAPKIDYLAIITAYVPSPEKWDEGFTKRRKP